MMNVFALLFKKDVDGYISAFKQDKKHWDVMNIISTLVLFCIICGVFIFVFFGFAKLYLGTTLDDIQNGADRAYELLTFVVCCVVVVNVIVGVRQIYRSLNESKDCDVLIFQPIAARTIFFYKLTGIYIGQVLFTALLLIPAAITMDVLSAFLGGVGFYFALLLVILLLPMATCAVAALLSIPYTIIMRFVESRFIIHLVLYVVLIALGFWLYSIFLSTLSQLLQSGEITYVFDRNTLNSLNILAHRLFPSNFVANILFGEKVWQSVLVFVAISAAACAITYFVIQAMYTRIMQDKMEGNGKVYHNKSDCKSRSVTATLLRKEFIVVLRTPSYAFQYLATAVTLPFMVYVCVYLMRSMMATLTVLNCDYELAIFVISMFCILTNTFCTTNISRDGKMFAMLKTMPVTCKEIVKTKFIFCGIVSALSVLASCITLVAVGYLAVWQALFVAIMAMLLSFAEIAYATRKDLNKPEPLQGDDGEIVESSGKTSTVALIGLVVSLLAGGGSLFLSTIVGIVSSAQSATLLSMLFVAVVIILVFALSLVYLFKGLEKRYYSDR